LPSTSSIASSRFKLFLVVGVANKHSHRQRAVVGSHRLRAPQPAAAVGVLGTSTRYRQAAPAALFGLRSAPSISRNALTLNAVRPRLANSRSPRAAFSFQREVIPTPRRTIATNMRRVSSSPPSTNACNSGRSRAWRIKRRQARMTQNDSVPRRGAITQRMRAHNETRKQTGRQYR
jgi:hypothetical protein